MNTQPTSLRLVAVLAASSLFALGLAACGRTEAPAPEKTPIAQQTPPPAEPAAAKPMPPATPPPAATPATPATSPVAAPASKPTTTTPAAATPAQTPAPTATAPATTPAPTAPPAPPSTAPAPAKPTVVPLPVAIEPQATTPTTPPAPQPTPPAPSAPASGVSDPGGEIAVAATKSGPTRVGAERCKVCHKVQYASWAETAHAKRKPALECENCHGAGSEYKVMATMKDAAKAKAAGLVIPEAKFCQTCHKQGWKDELLKKAHAHKAG